MQPTNLSIHYRSIIDPTSRQTSHYRSIIDPLSIHYRSIVDPSCIRLSIHYRSIIDPASWIDPGSIHYRSQNYRPKSWIDNFQSKIYRSIIDPLSIQNAQKLSIQEEAKIKAEGGFATQGILWIDNHYRSMDRSEIIDPKVGSIIFLKNWIDLGSIHSGSILTPPGSIQKVFFIDPKNFLLMVSALPSS